MDNLGLWERHDAEQERWLNKRPVCCECRGHIQEEHLFDFDGDLVCENCLPDYAKRNFKQSTEKYMEV